MRRLLITWVTWWLHWWCIRWPHTEYNLTKRRKPRQSSSSSPLGPLHIWLHKFRENRDITDHQAQLSVLLFVWLKKTSDPHKHCPIIDLSSFCLHYLNAKRVVHKQLIFLFLFFIKTITYCLSPDSILIILLLPLFSKLQTIFDWPWIISSWPSLLYWLFKGLRLPPLNFS